MKYMYTEHCAAGFVQFTHAQTGETVKMPEGKAVEVPDWLAKKLAGNGHFQAVQEPAQKVAERHEGGTHISQPGVTESTDNFDDLSSAEQNDKPPRGKPGPKPKPKPEDA